MLNTQCLEANEVAPGVRASAATPYDLSLIPGAHVVEEEDQLVGALGLGVHPAMEKIKE